MPAAILSCTCEHEAQDQRYGKGNRVHNSTLKPAIGWRCTVCDKHKVK